MTDLERARRMLRDWGDEADTVIADELAAARREGAEAAAAQFHELEFVSLNEVKEAERRGAAEMRERAAQTADLLDGYTSAEVADAIRALPLTPEEPA